MTPKQFAELLEYIQENNSWGDNMYEIGIIRRRKTVKYVRSCYDSRDGRVWSISLDLGGNNEKDFEVESEEGIKRIYKWLDELI